MSQTVTKGAGPSMPVAVDGLDRVVGNTCNAAGFRRAVSGGGRNARVRWNDRFFLRGTGGGVLAVYEWECMRSGLADDMTTPEQRASENRRVLREGDIAHECEALGQFGEMTWEDIAADSSRTADQWVAGFGALSPATEEVRVANHGGIPIAPMPGVRGVNDSGRPNGFARACCDGVVKNPEIADPFHHFGAFSR